MPSPEATEAPTPLCITATRVCIAGVIAMVDPAATASPNATACGTIDPAASTGNGTATRVAATGVTVAGASVTAVSAANTSVIPPNNANR